MTSPLNPRLSILNPRLAACGLSLAVLIAGCQRQENEFKAPPPPTVTIAQPLTKSVTDYFFTTGNTRSVNKVELRARVAGYLDSIEFEDGDVVEKGDLLFVIDKAPYEAAVAAATAEVAKSAAELKLAEAQLKRETQLIQRGAGTESQLDVAQAERASAAANVDAAKAALQQAQLDLNYTEIHAPFTGKMGAHQVDVGNLVQVGTTILAEIESIDPIYATFYISEADMLQFRGLQASGTVPSEQTEMPPIELAIGDVKNKGSEDAYPFKGTFDFSSFGVDPSTGTNMSRAVFQNPDERLVPGLFVSIRAAIGEPTEHLVVEERAISTDQRGEYLLIVNDENKVEYRPVVLGQRVAGAMRVVKEGLQPDEFVVINGLLSARPGSTVNPEKTKMKELDTATATASSFILEDPETEAQLAAGEEASPAAGRRSTAIGFRDRAGEEPGAAETPDRVDESHAQTKNRTASATQPGQPANQE